MSIGKLFTVSSLACALVACTGDVVGPTGTTSLRADTRVPEAEGATRVTVASDSLTIQFDGAPPAYAVGDVVYGSEGGGYLRRITGIDRGERELVLRTEAAELGEAFDELHVAERVAVVPAAQPAIGPTWRTQAVRVGDRVYTAEIRHDAAVAGPSARTLSRTFVWEFPRLSITLTDPQGHVALVLAADKLRVEKALTLDVDVDFAFFKLEELRFVTEDDTHTTIEGLSVDVTGVLPVAETSIPVFDAPALAVVPVGPLVFTVGASVELGASVALAAAAEVHTTSSVGFHSWSRRGITWDGDFTIVDEREVDVDADFGRLEASVTPLVVDASVFVTGAVRFALYGVLGPELYARVSPLAASLSFGTEGVDGRLSASASAGARFRFPFFKLAALNVTFASWSQPYASFHHAY